MKRTFRSYSDPGHAWVCVTREELNKLGITDKITSYSYQRADKVYLEEDCDLNTFCLALNAHGVEAKFKERHTEKSSKIRSYDRFVA